MSLRIGADCLTLDRDDVLLMKVPFNYIRAVEARPLSVASQLRSALFKRVPIFSWVAFAKTVLMLFAILVYVSSPQMNPQALASYLMSSVGLSLAFHLPLVFIPNAWRIEGRRWRLRLIAMDDRSFTVVMDSVVQQEFFALLRASHLVVYADPRAETWLDRRWPKFKKDSREVITFILTDLF
jgi:hypothetical protein